MFPLEKHSELQPLLRSPVLKDVCGSARNSEWIPLCPAPVSSSSIYICCFYFICPAIQVFILSIMFCFVWDKDFSLNFFLLFFFNFKILYWFSHISKWIRHRYTCVPHPEPSSLPVPSLWVVPVHQPQASSIVHWSWIGDSFHIWYYTCFNAILPNHPTLSLFHRVQKTSIHQCLFCCLVYRVIVTIFLNSIYMH